MSDWDDRKGREKEPRQFDLQLRYDIESSLRLNDGHQAFKWMRGSQWQLKQ